MLPALLGRPPPLARGSARVRSVAAAGRSGRSAWGLSGFPAVVGALPLPGAVDAGADVSGAGAGAGSGAGAGDGAGAAVGAGADGAGAVVGAGAVGAGARVVVAVVPPPLSVLARVVVEDEVP
ncbi:MAG: hypothetical protein JJ872_07665 [Marivivens sp.]|nr:hypothetical protein [Marivivens sp.]